MRILENGDETVVADRGLNLSKGQQTRINLARAVYRDADIYLIDDAFAALDARVQEQIFNNCIKRYLKNKIVVLVTHNVEHIKQADKVVVLDKGSIKYEGDQEEFSKNVLKTLDCQLQYQKTERTTEELEISENTKLLESKLKKPAIYHEVKKEGGVDFINYVNYFKSGGGVFFLFVIIFLVLAVSTFSSSQKMITNW